MFDKAQPQSMPTIDAKTSPFRRLGFGGFGFATGKVEAPPVHDCDAFLHTYPVASGRWPFHIVNAEHVPRRESDEKLHADETDAARHALADSWWPASDREALSGPGYQVMPDGAHQFDNDGKSHPLH